MVVVHRLVAMFPPAMWHLDSALMRSWARGGLNHLGSLSSGSIHACVLGIVCQLPWSTMWDFTGLHLGLLILPKTQLTTGAGAESPPTPKSNLIGKSKSGKVPREKSTNSAEKKSPRSPRSPEKKIPKSSEKESPQSPEKKSPKSPEKRSPKSPDGNKVKRAGLMDRAEQRRRNGIK